MSLEVAIESMRYEPPRVQIKSYWLRRVFRLPALATPELLIEDLNLKVDTGEVLAVVGASAAGKTTLLRIMAGLENGYKGSTHFNGEPITRPDKRIYLMPQAHTLLPWMSVERNLLFNAREGDRSAPDLLHTFGMTDRRDFFPHTLSGGERARVALMCAMCANPQVLLLDEPFRGLDELTKDKCVDDLKAWLAATKEEESVVLVSHDISDAVFLADRVIVVRRRPLGVHRVFESPGPKTRRSDDVIAQERDVYDALAEVAAQPGDAADAALPRR